METGTGINFASGDHNLGAAFRRANGRECTRALGIHRAARDGDPAYRLIRPSGANARSIVVAIRHDLPAVDLDGGIAAVFTIAAADPRAVNDFGADIAAVDDDRAGHLAIDSANTRIEAGRGAGLMVSGNQLAHVVAGALGPDGQRRALRHIEAVMGLQGRAVAQNQVHLPRHGDRGGITGSARYLDAAFRHGVPAFAPGGKLAGGHHRAIHGHLGPALSAHISNGDCFPQRRHRPQRQQSQRHQQHQQCLHRSLHG